MPRGQYAFNAPAVDGGTNRVNTSGRPNIAAATLLSRASLRYANIIQAGRVLTLPCDGTQFYLTTATGTLSIKPSRGVFSDYSEGQGLQTTDENSFSLLEIKNNGTIPVVFEIFVGFQGFIDNRLILSLTNQKIVCKPTNPVASGTTVVDITDVSGQAFTDVNGGEWYALYREAFYVFNPDTGVTLLVQKANSLVSNGPAVAVVYPQTSLRLPYSGNFRLHLGGGAINAIVSEGYAAIPKTIT